MGGIMQPERGQMEPTTLEELKELISSNLQSMARNFCAVLLFMKTSVSKAGQLIL